MRYVKFKDDYATPDELGLLNQYLPHMTESLVLARSIAQIKETFGALFQMMDRISNGLEDLRGQVHFVKYQIWTLQNRPDPSRFDVLLASNDYLVESGPRFSCRVTLAEGLNKVDVERISLN